MKAILLAGGQGTRLRPLTLNTPKPVVPIFGRPFLHYQIDRILQVPEIDEIVLSLNYQPERIEAVFGDGSSLGTRIRYVVEPAPLGTAGGIKFASRGIDDTIVVFNGDVLTQIDLAAVIAMHRARSATATIVLTPVDNPAAYGLVETDAGGNILRFIEKPDPAQITTNYINAGIYVLEPSTFDRIPDGVPWSIERKYFPSLVERRRDVRRLPLRRLLDRHRHARQVRPGPPRHPGGPFPCRAVRHAVGVPDGGGAATRWWAPGPPSKARPSSTPGSPSRTAPGWAPARGRPGLPRRRGLRGGGLRRVAGLRGRRRRERSRRGAGRACRMGAVGLGRRRRGAGRPDRPDRLHASLICPPFFSRADPCPWTLPSSRPTTFAACIPPKSTRLARGRSAAGSSPTWAPGPSACRATCASRLRRCPRRSSTACARRAPTWWTTACWAPTSCTTPWRTTGWTAARRSPRRTTRSSTTASRWCGPRRCRSAATPASARSAT